MQQNSHLGAIILAAGRGSRMNSAKTNKVAMVLADKPLIQHSVNLLEEMKIQQIIVVVGFAKDSVKNVLKNSSVVFAEQKKQLGTADALGSALAKLNSYITDILVIQGDDSHFYTQEVISKLIDLHRSKKTSITFLTIESTNQFGLGRIVRDKKGKVTAIVEEKDASEAVRKIKEVNPACYIFKVSFLKKYLSKIEKSKISGEYYLTSLIDIAIKNKEEMYTFNAGKMLWRGINTKEELQEAEKLHLKLVE